MKRVYIIHGWGGHSSSEPWFQWLTDEAEKRGYGVSSLDMPNTDHPKIEEWVKYLEKNIEEVDEHTFFVGHSIGCQTILRYFEKLHKHKKVGGAVFIAPWFDLINQSPEEMIIARPWINTKIDFSRIFDHTTKFLAIFSHDDPCVHVDQADKFKKNLGARIIIKKHEEHFNDTKRIPEIFEVIR